MSPSPTRNLAVVVLAAGRGTRMKSATPKALHPVLGMPMVGQVLWTAQRLAPRRIVVVTGHQGERVQEWIAARVWLSEVAFVEQNEQRGTGHAVRAALPALGDAEELLVLYCDGPLLQPETLEGLLAARGEGLVSLMTAEPDDPTGYGRVLLDADGRIERIVEHADADGRERTVGLVNAGTMALDRAFAERSLVRLRADNAPGELYLTDLLAMARDEGRPGAPVVADWEEARGINDRAELASATATLQRRVHARLMAAGVSIEAPRDTVIEVGVEIAPDVTIRGGVELRGATSIGRGTLVERGCLLNGVRVGEEVHFKPYSVATDSIVGDGCAVGPFAHLRPGSELRSRAKVGNFVETKKALLREGVKASHLSYIGDADIGSASNIGAGTITCNYDGERKHRTVLGRGVFIGSNSALVAPVRLGDGAYVGAGSTITADVPAGALAVARGRQYVKPGWARDKG